MIKVMPRTIAPPQEYHSNPPAPPLVPGYYLTNFEEVLREAGRRYRDLLSAEEAGRLDRFATLPEPARRLYVRMLTRQGPWFRPDGLRYPEIPALPAALASLEAHGFCVAAGAATVAELVALLRKDELGDWLRHFGLPRPRSLPRPALAAALIQGVPAATLQAELAAALGAVALLGRDWARLLCFLFFGNGEQDLSAFVLMDLGRVQYEAYPVEPGDRLFQTRAEVDFLLALRELREAFEAGAELEPLTGQLLTLAPSPGVRQQRRYHRLLNDLGREWERRAGPDQALACYALSQRPPARERRVRVLAGLGRLQEATALALEIAASPAEVGEERFARQYLTRAAARQAPAGQWLAAHPEPPPVPELRLLLPRHPSGSVELAALEAAAGDGWEGFFTENALWNGLFGLALWDQLFAPVPGAFHHRLQSAPADLASPDFHARRAEAIAARFRELERDGVLAAEILRTARAKQGIANAFVNWRNLPEALLAAALEALPAAAVLSVLRTMAPNPLAFDSGFPDLLLVKRDERRCRLWEVKGPGDSLRPEQERWLKHFNQVGVEARIAWVKYLDP
jgi:hypothetical protein